MTAKWERLPQDVSGGNHYFTGKYNYTKKVHIELSFEEIMYLYNDIKAFVQQNPETGIYYFQTYVNLENPEMRLFFIDVPQLNTCNLLFDTEFVSKPTKKAQLV